MRLRRAVIGLGRTLAELKVSFPEARSQSPPTGLAEGFLRADTQSVRLAALSEKLSSIADCKVGNAKCGYASGRGKPAHLETRARIPGEP
ncbi:transcription termination factor 2, mitochondrial isoform X3 [Petaurus breviceps papuanus]|uniref:transcription termination factor 2, mitochondrial isoform X3 n=1 Tax=Petaurus breviceps papuanus TaxID=3040969 RepID=UPI0036DBE46C